MKTKRFLSIALTLVMLVGMFPGMNLTASAAGNTTEITPTNTSGTMTITLTISEKQPATVTKAPEAKTLTYNGSAQELVTAGEATGGEMQYALGNATEATQPYTTSIPTATNAGTYYVWYRAKGNEGYPDSEAKCIEVAIREKGSEDVETEGAIEIKISNESLKIIDASLAQADPELKKKVDEALAEGKDIEFVFESSDLGDSAEGAGDIRGYNESQGLELGKFFDLTLQVRINGEVAGNITGTSQDLNLEVLIPGELYSPDRIFYILRFHEGSVSEVGSGRGHSVPIKTDGFSTYAIAYKEVSEEPHDDEKHEDKKHKEKDHTPPSWVLNPNEKQALGITYTGLAPGTTAGYQEQGEAAKALLTAATPKGCIKAFSFNLLNGGVPDQTLKLGTLTMFIHPEWQKAGRQYAMLSLDKYGNVAFLPDIDTDPIRCTVNLNFEGYALDVLYKDP